MFHGGKHQILGGQEVILIDNQQHSEVCWTTRLGVDFSGCFVSEHQILDRQEVILTNAEHQPKVCRAIGLREACQDSLYRLKTVLW